MGFYVNFLNSNIAKGQRVGYLNEYGRYVGRDCYNNIVDIDISNCIHVDEQ